MFNVDENKMNPVVYALWMLLPVIFFPFVGIYILWQALKELAEERALEILNEYEKEQEELGNYEY